jgi:hypothetical protein
VLYVLMLLLLQCGLAFGLLLLLLFLLLLFLLLLHHLLLLFLPLGLLLTLHFLLFVCDGALNSKNCLSSSRQGCGCRTVGLDLLLQLTASLLSSLPQPTGYAT